VADPGNTETYDYVIVGSGAAGSIIAHRLGEDPGTRVCVIETGPRDWHPYIRIPAGFMKLFFDPRFTFQYLSAPVPGLDGRRIGLPQGRVIGGSSSINGMFFSRGQRGDYDEWAGRGNRGWGYLDMLPYLKRIEHATEPADATYRGTDGPMPFGRIDLCHPLSETFIEAAVGLGLPRNTDFNAAVQDGVGWVQRNVRRGRRHSAAHAYLKPAMRRGNVRVLSGLTATGIAFDGNRATGVFCRRGPSGSERTIRAGREVILAAGTVNSAKLLQLSGIGPSALLNGLGIPVRRDLPAGENFRDHYGVRMVARVKGIRTLNEEVTGLRLAGHVARWLAGRPSVLTVGPAHVHWYWKSRPELNAADFQGVFTPASSKDGVMGLLDDKPGMTIGVNQHRPESIGWVRAVSRDPFADPEIQPNYLADPRDQAVLVSGLKIGRQIFQTPQLAPYFDGETAPGPGVNTDDEWLDFARRGGNTNYHLIGTCRMGPASDGSTVVDDQLRVHGIDGLRVADASVMPTMVSANTYVATMAIAEKASDLIRGRPPLPRVDGVS
jgi:choline dehydrogenase